MVDPPGALMPDFEITAPDGRKFIVTAPDGATQDEVLAYAQKQHGSARPLNHPWANASRAASASAPATQSRVSGSCRAWPMTR